MAYLELGGGDITLIILFGLWSHVEVAWEEPNIRGVLQRLAQRWRVVLMDRRGTGLSERVGVQQSTRTGTDDVEAVREAVGAEKVWLMGNSVGGTIAIEYAHRHAQRVQGLLLCGACALGTWADDYPWALTSQQLDLWLEELRKSWGQATSWEQFAPLMAVRPDAQDWWVRMLRQSLTRNSVPLVLQAFAAMDVRHLLPTLRLPTLIVQREGDRVVRQGAARYLAEMIPARGGCVQHVVKVVNLQDSAGGGGQHPAPFHHRPAAMSESLSRSDDPCFAPPAVAKRPAGRFLQRLWQSLLRSEREAYFARATDLADLERRQRAWENASGGVSVQSMVGWR